MKRILFFILSLFIFTSFSVNCYAFEVPNFQKTAKVSYSNVKYKEQVKIKKKKNNEKEKTNIKYDGKETKEVYTYEEFEARISYVFLENINSLRKSYNLNLLTKGDKVLIDASKIRSKEASDCWSHTRPNGEDSLTLIPNDRWAGENLCYYVFKTDILYTEENVQEYVSKMFEMLCNSPTHFDNMIFKDFNKISINTYQDGLKLTTAFIFSS